MNDEQLTELVNSLLSFVQRVATGHTSSEAETLILMDVVEWLMQLPSGE